MYAIGNEQWFVLANDGKFGNVYPYFTGSFLGEMANFDSKVAEMMSLRATLIALSILCLIPGCGSESDDSEPVADSGGDTTSDLGGDAGSLAGDIVTGQAVYEASCSFCHTLTGSQNGSTPALTDRVPYLSEDEIIDVILNGKGSMPGYEGTLKDQEIVDVAAYLRSAFGS